MLKTIVKGTIKSIISITLTVIIPMILFINLGGIVERGVQESLGMHGITFLPKNISGYLALILLFSVIIGILEESTYWKVFGKSLRIILYISSLAIMYFVTNGGLVSRSIIAENYLVRITVNISILLYLYGFFVVLPAIVSTVFDIGYSLKD